MGMQVSYCICTEISQAGNLQRHKSRCGNDTGNAMPKKRDRDHGGRMYAGSCTYAGKDSTEILSVRDSGVSEREKFADDI